MSACYSVLMAEAASLALATSVIQVLNLNCCSYLSDCQQLVHFLNMATCRIVNNWFTSSTWLIQPTLQTGESSPSLRSSTSQELGHQESSKSAEAKTTADALARQAFSSQLTDLETTCPYELCPPQCCVLQALHLVDLTDVTVLAATCC
jgi:hypothetical protein